MKRNITVNPLKVVAFWLLAVITVLGMASCSETNNDMEEFPQWQSRNDSYWTDLYNTTKKKVDAGDTSWKIFLNYTKGNQTNNTSDALNYAPTDYIIVHVEENGTGTTTPLYTDSVAVHYQGRMIPSTTYTSGLVYSSSWGAPTFDSRTARAAHWAVNASLNTQSIVVDGLTTALQKMRVGDHWTVYVPYQLGYGASTYGILPAYSNLIFDLRLAKIAPVGTALGDN